MLMLRFCNTDANNVNGVRNKGLSVIKDCACPLPHYEVWMSLLHDVFLGADVLLLPRVHDMPLFQNLHGKRFGLLTFELHLRGKSGWAHELLLRVDKKQQQRQQKNHITNKQCKWINPEKIHELVKTDKKNDRNFPKSSKNLNLNW